MAHRRYTLLSSFLVVFIASIAFHLIKPALAIKIRTELQATAIEITAITSGFMVFRAIAAPMAGAAGDKSPALRNYIVRLSLFLITLVALAYAYVPEPFFAVVLSAIQGFFSGMLWPTLQVIVGFSAPEAKRGAYLGAYFTIGAFGSSIGYALYGYLPLSGTYLILIGAALYGLSALIAAFLFPAHYAPERDIKTGEKGDKLNLRGFQPITIWVLMVSFAIGGIIGLMNEYLYIFLHEVHGLAKSELGYVLTMATLVGIFSGLLSGFLSDRFGIKNVLTILMLLSSVSLFSLAVSSEMPVVALSLAVVLLASKATFPITRNIAVAGNKAVAGTVVGLSNTLSNAGSALFPLIAGYLYEVSGKDVVFGIDGRALPLVLSSTVVFLLALVSPFLRER